MRHTPLSRTLLLFAYLQAALGLLLASAPLIILSSLLLFTLLSARQAPPEHASVDTRPEHERAQRSTPITVHARARLDPGPRLGLLHQPLPETFLLTDGSNLLLAHEDTLEERFQIAAPRRGRYKLEAPTLTLVHPLLFAPSTEHAHGTPHEVTIEPTSRPLTTLEGIRGPGTPEPGEDPGSKGPASTEFRELRDYQQGDPLKHVNWKATAKRSPQELDLVVNEYEPEARKNIWFFLDLHDSLEVGTTLDTALEDAIEMTLALVHHYATRGHRVGGTTFNGPDPDTFYPDAGTRQHLIIARTLAHADPGPRHEGLPAAVERVQGFLARERPLTFVLTRPEVHTDALHTGLQRIHRYVSTRQRTTPVTVLAPQPPHATPSDRLAHALRAHEADQALARHATPLVRVHRLTDGARGLERALAQGAMQR